MPYSPAPLDPLLFETPVRACRFLLVIAPNAAVEEQVKNWKTELRARIGGFSGSHSIPHITLFFADLPAECERDLTEGIARGCEGQRPFDLRSNGITHFPDKKTIYIDLLEKEAIGALRTNIVSHVRGSKRIKKLGVNPTDHPHLTIAAGLKPGQFEEAWKLLAPHTHASEQRVSEVLLLRRDLRPAGTYEVVRHFPLA